MGQKPKIGGDKDSRDVTPIFINRMNSVNFSISIFSLILRFEEKNPGNQIQDKLWGFSLTLENTHIHPKYYFPSKLFHENHLNGEFSDNS